MIEKMLKKSSKGQHLLNMLNTSSHAFVVGSVACYALLTLAVGILFFILIKNKVIHKLPWDVKVGLTIYAIYAPFTLSLFMSFLIRGDWWLILEHPPYCVSMIFAFGLFLANHWKFSSQYLRTAAMIKKVFQSKFPSLKEMQEIAKRKKLMNILEVSVHACLILFELWLMFMSFDSDFFWPITFEIFWFVSILGFTSVTLLSMNHIRKCSKALEHIGVHNNSIQMIIYVSCWTLSAFVSPTMIGISVYMNQNLITTAIETV